VNRLGKLSDSIYTGVLGAIVATVIATILKKAWSKATGSAPPNPRDPNASAREAIVWAAVSGLGVGVAGVLTSRISAARAQQHEVDVHPAQSMQ